MGYKSTVGTSYGELYGLDIRSLTNDQLRAIDASKLIEFLNVDPRVEPIIVESIRKASTEKEAVGIFSRFKDIEDIKQHQYLLREYNVYIRSREKSLTKQSKAYGFPSRYHFIKWDWLDDATKDREIQRFLTDKSTSFSAEKVDYDSMFRTKPETARLIANKVMSQETYVGWDSQTHLMATMPKNMMSEFMFPIFKDKKKHRELAFHTLSNKNLPHKYIVKAVRWISRRSKGLAPINVTLGKKVWEDIPTVTRLNCMESIIYYTPNRQSIDFGDLNTEDDIRTLLFSAVLKYHSRVERLINRFSSMYLKSNKQLKD